MAKQKWTYMAGTEGSGEYKVVVRTRYGTLGFRDLGDTVRIRVEPVDDPKVIAKMSTLLTRAASWKQPGDGGQRRFSIVVSKAMLANALSVAKQALGVGRLKSRQNPSANTKARALAKASE